MAKVEFIHTGGPFGDCTDNYDVVTDATTLGELITALLGKDSFQTFCLREKDGIGLGGVCLAHAIGGVITRKSSNYDSLLSMKLKKAKVNGGYGNMTYDIWVEGKLPHQDRQEFQMVYWGHTS